MHIAELISLDDLCRLTRSRVEGAIVFLKTRALAEEWTFRYLGAALAERRADDT